MSEHAEQAAMASQEHPPVGSPRGAWLRPVYPRLAWPHLVWPHFAWPGVAQPPGRVRAGWPGPTLAPTLLGSSTPPGSLDRPGPRRPGHRRSTVSASEETRLLPRHRTEGSQPAHYRHQSASQPRCYSVARVGLSDHLITADCSSLSVGGPPSGARTRPGSELSVQHCAKEDDVDGQICTKHADYGARENPVHGYVMP